MGNECSTDRDRGSSEDWDEEGGMTGNPNSTANGFMRSRHQG